MKWLALDPGLLSCGWVVGTLSGPDGGGCIHTPKAPKKRNLKSAADDFERSQRLTRALAAIMDEHEPQVVCYESMSLPRNASTAGKLGRAYGIIGALTTLTLTPIIAVSPQEVKEAALGRKSGTKSAIHGALVRLYGADALQTIVADTREELHDHVVDALGVWHASKDSEVYRAMIDRGHMRLIH